MAMEIKERYDDYLYLQCGKCGYRLAMCEWQLDEETRMCWECAGIKTIEHHKNEDIVVYKDGSLKWISKPPIDGTQRIADGCYGKYAKPRD